MSLSLLWSFVFVIALYEWATLGSAELGLGKVAYEYSNCNLNLHFDMWLGSAPGTAAAAAAVAHKTIKKSNWCSFRPGSPCRKSVAANGNGDVAVVVLVGR